MKYDLPKSCLKTLLNISQDIYIIIEKNTLKLLDWNLAFERLNIESIMHNETIFLSNPPYKKYFSGLKELIAIQTQLLQNGSSHNDFSYLPLGEPQHNPYAFSAKIIHILEEEEALLLHLCMDNSMELHSRIAMQSLERRDALLTATSKAAQELLSDNDNFDATINTVLGILGEATNVDRVYVWSIHEAPNPEEDDRLYTSQLYEWSEGAEPQQGNEIVTNMLVEEGIPTWIGTFLEGKCVNNLVKNMPQGERDVLEPQDIISILTAPIIFHGHLWGFIGFDNCHAEYIWSHAEEHILRTAGTLIGTAIHSRRTNTALYAAQERFCSVEEATGDIIWSVDEEQNINYISPRIKAVLQYAPAEIIGKPFNALLLHPDEFQCTATADDFIMRDFELRAKCKDGSIKWLRSSCKYTFDAHGKLLYGFGSSSDITHIHETQEALEIANKELEESIHIANDLVESANKANAIKGAFLANMSHEIRTPLNAVIGITHLLKHTNLDKIQDGYIKKISSSGELLLGIVNNILDFSKIQDGNMAIDKYSFALHSIFDELEQNVFQWIKEKELKLTFDIHPDVHKQYIGDAVRLKQILTSLITNAIKFTHEGSIHIAVRVESENNETALLHFSVQDTGIGIPKEHIDTLFQRFTQADISSTRKYGGIGLGLALCKNLTILMGGNIWCTSTPGQGSVFNFTCRLEKTIQQAPTSTRPLKEIRIMAAFPNQESFEQLQAMLLPLGYTHLRLAVDSMSITDEITTADKPDIILLHHEFNEAALFINVLKANNDYFNNTPVIYFTPREQIHAPASVSVIHALEASTLHDSFINTLGPSFEQDSALYEQGFEKLLRENHSGKKILLIEDNEVNQMIAQAILEELGFIVTIANDGREGCQRIYEDTFDLVIMDIQMPVMDGLSAARKIREDTQFAHIPIIALTAHATEEDREKSLRAGMNDHITKPIDAAQLFKLLLYWLSKDKAAPSQ